MTSLPDASLDYETYSEVDIRTAGLWVYARHPSTKILIAGYRLGKGTPARAWSPGEVSTDVRRVFDGRRIWAFNALFEYAITKYVATRQFGWEMPPDSVWCDTQAIARMCCYPGSLDELAKALGLRHQKDKEGARLIRKFSIPGKDGKQFLPHQDRADFTKFKEYCRQDVLVECEARAALPVQELPPFEQRVWHEDRIINERGVPVDRAMATGASRMATVAKAKANEVLSDMTNGVITSVGQSKRIRAMAVSLGYPLPGLKKDQVAAALLDDDLPPLLRDILDIRAESNMSSLAKYAAMLKAIDPDNRIRGVHAYHAATTGRWGGRIVQFQNIPRPKHALDAIDHELIRQGDYESLALLYRNVLPVLRDALRNTIRTLDAEGYLLVTDKSSIEARVLGFLADDEGYMTAFRAGKDLYVEIAAVIFNKKPEDVTEDERWVGKSCILGLGFGMGEKTFGGTCEKNGRKLPAALIKHSVKVYRTLYKKIPLYWRTVEDACFKAIREKTRVDLPHGVFAEMVGKHLSIGLPSGRRLWYPEAQIKMSLNAWGNASATIQFKTHAKGQWVTASTYGGRLVENIVQAVARDLLCEALFKCEDQKLFPIMHVHDEIVCEPNLPPKPKRAYDSSNSAVSAKKAIFNTPPRWAPGLPLGCKATVTPFYKK